MLSKALDILEALEMEKEPVSLEFLARQHPQIAKSTIYRVLQTFASRGYLARNETLYSRLARPKRMRFGFAGQSEKNPFAGAVVASLRSAAMTNGVELMERDNQYSNAGCVRNSKDLVANGADMIIGFQIEEQSASLVGHTISSAGIPLITVDTSIPHAVYFGVDNFKAGFEAGELLAKYARAKWKGTVDWVLGLNASDRCSLVNSRIAGSFEGVQTHFPRVSLDRYVQLNVGSERGSSAKVVGEFLQSHALTDRILITAATDTSALGTLQAVRDASREQHTAIVGQEGIPEMLVELRGRKGALIGSVSHEAQTYGPQLIQLGVAMLRGHITHPYNFVQHKAVVFGLA